MLSLVRQGGRVLMIKTSQAEAVSDWLKKNLPSQQYDIMEIGGNAGPGQTMALISPTWNVEDVSFSFAVDRYPEEVVQDMFNCRNQFDDVNLKFLPPLFFFRVTGDLRPIMEEIESDFNGTRGDRDEILYDVMSYPAEKGIAVLFTDKPLNRNLHMGDFFKEMLHIDMPPQLLFRHLQWHAVSYFNEGLVGKEWNLVEIRIYDSHSRYRLHCERLRFFLEACEMGLTIGEGWGRDYAHILMPLKVYTMKILTFYSPKVLKKALMALEYSEDGERFVDFDLYFNRKKIGWTELSEDIKWNRQDHSMNFRKEIMGNLLDFQRQEILNLEKEIMGNAAKKEPGKA